MKTDQQKLANLAKLAELARDLEISRLGQIQARIRERTAIATNLRQKLQTHRQGPLGTTLVANRFSVANDAKWEKWVEQEIMCTNQRIALLREQEETQLESTRFCFGRAAVANALISRMNK